MSTRQLLEDIRSHLLGEEKVTYYGFTCDVIKSYSDDEAQEYCHDVKYKGKEIGYYYSDGDEESPDSIAAYSRNDAEDSWFEAQEPHEAVEWIISTAIDGGFNDSEPLISEGKLDKAKQMAMKFLKKIKKSSKKAKKMSKAFIQFAKKKGKKV